MYYTIIIPLIIMLAIMFPLILLGIGLYITRDKTLKVQPSDFLKIHNRRSGKSVVDMLESRRRK